MSKAELQHTDNGAEGVSRSHWVLQLGKTQRHVSWKVDGMAEVKVRLSSPWRSIPNLSLAFYAQYFVRVVFKPPPCSMIKQLPAFEHDEVIKLTSESWLDPVIAEELRHLPSLGLAPAGLTTNRLTPRSSLSTTRL